jgi:cytochrome P450
VNASLSIVRIVVSSVAEQICLPNLDSAEFLAAPHEVYAQLRQSAASRVCFVEGRPMRMFFSYESVLSVLRDKRFIAEEYPCAAVLGEPEDEGGYRDSETYKRLRRFLANRSFLNEWRKRAALGAAEILSAHQSRGRIDLVSELAEPLMLNLTARLLGVDAECVNRWGAAFSSVADAGEAYVTRAQRAAAELVEHIDRQLAERDGDPFALLSVLKIYRDPPSAREAARSIMVILAAGHGTTSDMIANAIVVLLQGGLSLAALRDKPSGLALAIEEALRLNPSVHQVLRTVTEDCEIDGARMAQGETVSLALASANRDGSIFQEPDKVCLGRAGPPHTAFGHGPSYCIGSALARVIIHEALSALARMAPNGRLLDDALHWKPSGVLRGPAAAHFLFQ